MVHMNFKVNRWIWLFCLNVVKSISCFRTWSERSRLSWLRRRTIWRSVLWKLYISRVRTWFISMARILSVWWSIWRSVWWTMRTWISFIVFISWSVKLWRSSSSVISVSVSRVRAISIFWLFIAICITMTWCTSTTVSIIRICRFVIFSVKIIVTRRRTEVLYKWFLRRFRSSIGVSFVFIISLFLETRRDGVICFMNNNFYMQVRVYYWVLWVV